MSKELTTRPGASVTAEAWREWPAEQVELIKKTVAKDATNAELYHFLTLAARYDLDPFAKEIWFAKGRGRDGEPGRLLMMVGRDGLRKIATQQGLDVDADVVRVNDTFKVVRSVGGERHVHHEYEGGTEARGAIVGAWCEVRRGGRGLGYFFAPIEEYRPTDERKLKYSPWGSQTSVMILAAAERQALRQATPLSGLLAEGEMELNVEREQDAVSVDAEVALIPWPEGELGERLRAAVQRANELESNAYTEPQLQMLLSGRGEAELVALAEGIEAENVERERRAESAEALTEPAEAEVVQTEEELREQLATLEEHLDGGAFSDLGEFEEAEATAEAIRDELRKRGAHYPGQESML